MYPCPELQFKPQSDAERLHSLLECDKIDEGVICDLFVKKSSPQRLHIVVEYKKLYEAVRYLVIYKQ